MSIEFILFSRSTATKFTFEVSKLFSFKRDLFPVFRVFTHMSDPVGLIPHIVGFVKSRSAFLSNNLSREKGVLSQIILKTIIVGFSKSYTIDCIKKVWYELGYGLDHNGFILEHYVLYCQALYIIKIINKK